MNHPHPLAPRARTYVDPAEQQEANAYWSEREYKKWVVLFSRGPAYRRECREFYVAARDRESAIITGRAAAVLLNQPWARRAQASARLATHVDLGCQKVGL